MVPNRLQTTTYEITKIVLYCRPRKRNTKNYPMKNIRKYLGERCFATIPNNRSLSQKEVDSIAHKYLRAGNTLTRTAELIREAGRRKIAGRTARIHVEPTVWLALGDGWVQKTKIPCNYWEHGALRQRLAAWKARKEKEILNRVSGRVQYFLAAARYDITAVSRGEPSARAWCSTGGRYSSRCAFRKTYCNFEVRIPTDYEQAVLANELAEAHGLITLSAQEVGEGVYRAIWLRKGIGFSLHTEEGYIVRRGGEAAHGKTLQAARAILAKRERELRIMRLESAIQRQLSAGRPGEYGSIGVRLADSYAAGNCEPGTLAFRDRYFPGRDSATIDEILSVETNSDATRARAILACMRAIRRTTK